MCDPHPGTLTHEQNLWFRTTKSWWNETNDETVIPQFLWILNFGKLFLVVFQANIISFGFRRCKKDCNEFKVILRGSRFLPTKNWNCPRPLFPIGSRVNSVFTWRCLRGRHLLFNFSINSTIDRTWQYNAHNKESILWLWNMCIPF